MGHKVKNFFKSWRTTIEVILATVAMWKIASGLTTQIIGRMDLFEQRVTTNERSSAECKAEFSHHLNNLEYRVSTVENTILLRTGKPLIATLGQGGNP
jgi:hypothetical protein